MSPQISLGSNTPSSYYLGSNKVKKIYLGSTLLYSDEPTEITVSNIASNQTFRSSSTTINFTKTTTFTYTSSGNETVTINGNELSSTEVLMGTVPITLNVQSGSCVPVSSISIYASLSSPGTISIRASVSTSCSKGARILASWSWSSTAVIEG